MRLVKFATAILSCFSFTVLAADITPSFDYRFDFKSDDKGFNAGDTPDQYKNSFSLTTARLSLKADLDKQTTFKGRYNLTKTAIEEAYVTRTAESIPVFALVGMKKAYQGGYFQRKSSTMHLVGGAYLDEHKPFVDSYVPMIEVGYKIGESVLGAQIVNDITYANGGVHNDRHKQPAFIAHFDLKAKPFVSWIQYGSYDNNKSHFIDYSIGIASESFNLAVDYIYDSRDVDTSPAAPAGTAAGKPTSTRRDALTSLQIDAEYTVSQMMLFVQAAQYTRKQAGTDAKANVAAGAKVSIDDNAKEMALGVRALGLNKAFVPYVGFLARQADFFKGTTTEKESRLQRVWMAGLTGDI